MPQRVERFVAEQVFDVIQVGPGPDHLGGATAPERVRCHRHVQSHPSGVPMHPAQQAGIRQPFAVLVDEQRRFPGVSTATPMTAQPPPRTQDAVIFNEPGRRTTQR